MGARSSFTGPEYNPHPPPSEANNRVVFKRSRFPIPTESRSSFSNCPPVRPGPSLLPVPAAAPRSPAASIPPRTSRRSLSAADSKSPIARAPSACTCNGGHFTRQRFFPIDRPFRLLRHAGRHIRAVHLLQIHQLVAIPLLPPVIDRHHHRQPDDHKRGLQEKRRRQHPHHRPDPLAQQPGQVAPTDQDAANQQPSAAPECPPLRRSASPCCRRPLASSAAEA